MPINDEMPTIQKILADPNYIAADEFQRVVYRNEIVAMRMYAIDLSYTQFENGLLRERQGVGFAATTTSLALNTAAPLTAAKQTKDILSATAGFITSSRSAYENEILLKATYQVIVSQMRANRDEVKAKILQKIDQPISRYPLGSALSDVEEYYRAGTLASGVLKAGETAARAAETAEAQKVRQEVIEVKPSIDDATLALDAYLYPNNKPDAARNAKFRQLLAQRGVAARTPFVLNDGSMAQTRLSIARELGLLK